MSMFRKPKKPIQRRVFSRYDEDEENSDTKMDTDQEPVPNRKEKKTDKKIKDNEKLKKPSLLSFDDEGSLFFCFT